MNLQEEWNALNDQILLKADTRNAPGIQQIKAESGDVLQRIKKMLKIKMLWARGIALAAFLGFICTHGEIRYWLLGMFLVYESGRYLTIRKTKALRKDVDFSQVTREVLTSQLNLVKQALRIEQIWGYLFIPLSGPFGLMISHLAHGKSFHAILAQPKQIYILIGLALLGIPLIFLAEKMNKTLFSSYISKLQENIRLLEAD